MTAVLIDVNWALCGRKAHLPHFNPRAESFRLPCVLDFLRGIGLRRGLFCNALRRSWGQWVFFEGAFCYPKRSSTVLLRVVGGFRALYSALRWLQWMGTLQQIEMRRPRETPSEWSPRILS